MRISRRDLLRSVAAAPLMGMRETRVEVLTEGHCLSEESGRGFRRALGGVRRSVVVAAGMRNFGARQARELKRRVAAGEWLVFESAPDYSETQARCLADEFGVRVRKAPGTAGWSGEYVEYQAPVRKLVRPFLDTVMVEANQWTMLARLQCNICALERRLGCGKIIFLGSMIGPSLLADEREAHEVTAALLKS